LVYRSIDFLAVALIPGAAHPPGTVEDVRKRGRVP
jgi:hypothetical protein